MSIKIMSQVWETGPENQGELLVLLALADFADDRGNCWPSMKRIAEKARVQERSAIRILRRLEEKGFLEVEVGGGAGRPSKYRVLGRALAAPPPVDGPVPNNVRFVVYRRDGFVCQYCLDKIYHDRHGADDRTLDHIVPVSRGGDHSPENLVVCCASCNSKKGAKNLSEWVATGAVKNPDLKSLIVKNPDPDDTKTLTLSAENPDPRVTRTVIEPLLETSTIGQPEPDHDFDEFWKRWPLRRVNKQKARVSFNRLSQQNRADAISRVEEWARNWRAANPRATDIHPTSYLNGKRWEDDFGAASRFEADATVNRWRKLAGG